MAFVRAIKTAERYLRGKAQVFFSSLLYADDRLLGKDAFCLQEVVEHMSPFQLQRALDVIFTVYRPKHVLISTPNREYNGKFGLIDGKMRHRDHKFEFGVKEAEEFRVLIQRKYGYVGSREWVGESYVPAPRLEPVPAGATLTVSDEAVAPTFGFVFHRDF